MTISMTTYNGGGIYPSGFLGRVDSSQVAGAGATTLYPDTVVITNAGSTVTNAVVLPVDDGNDGEDYVGLYELAVSDYRIHPDNISIHTCTEESGSWPNTDTYTLWTKLVGVGIPPSTRWETKPIYSVVISGAVSRVALTEGPTLSPFSGTVGNCDFTAYVKNDVTGVITSLYLSDNTWFLLTTVPSGTPLGPESSATDVLRNYTSVSASHIYLDGDTPGFFDAGLVKYIQMAITVGTYTEIGAYRKFKLQVQGD